MNIEKLFSVGTTFNKRLYESEHQEIVKSMQDTYSEMDFFVFHENEFEKKKYGDGVEIKETWDKLHVYDVFEQNPWMYRFLDESPFKGAQTLGTPGTFDPPHYWKRNGIFWFRKVVAINSLLKLNVVKTPYLIWVGCDTRWNKKIDELFYNHIVKYNISHIDRVPLGHYTETDIVIFKIDEPKVQDFIRGWLDYYLSGEIFKQHRWDDCIAFDRTKDQFKDIVSFGSILDKTGCPFNAYDYLFHWKRPMHKIRDQREGI